MPEKKDDGDQSDDVIGAGLESHAEETTGNNATDNETGGEKVSSEAQMGDKMVSDGRDDITETTDVTAVSESKDLGENTESN